MTLIIAVLLLVVNASANLVYNGGFEVGGGSLAGWTVFTTPSGSTGRGLPAVAPFDTCAPDQVSNAAKFNVGTTDFPNQDGGGIYQNLNLAAGSYQLSVCTAVLSEVDTNQDGGLFELLFDGVVVDSYNYGYVSLGTTYRRLLADLVNVSAGNYEIRIRITRPWITDTSTPNQYIDNVTIVPEPATMALLGMGGLITLLKRKK